MAATIGLRLTRVRAVPFALVAVLANLALTLPLAYILNVWQDEAYTLHTTGAGLHYAFTQAVGFEQNAPLYFVALALWRSLNGSVFFLRLFTVICGALVVWLAPLIAQRYMPELDRRWIAITVAFNPVLIWAALEMRPYAAIMLLSALLLLTFYDAFLADEPIGRAWWFYTACCIAALYTQYYLAFLIAGEGICLLLAKRTALLRYGAAIAVTAIAFVPMLAILPGQMQNFRGIYSAPATPLQSVVTLVSIAVRYLLAPAAFPHPLVAYAGVAAALAAALFFLRRHAGNPPPRAWTLPIVTFTAYILLALAIYATHEHLLNRHAASLLLPTLLSVYAFAEIFREPVRRRAVACWSCLCLLFAAAALWNTYSPLAKPGDWIKVNAYITRHESAGQPIAVFQAENALPLQYYYHGPNRVEPIPRGVDFRRYNVADFVVRDQAELARTFPNSAKGTWLVNAGECSSANVQFGCDVLERYVAAHYRTVQDVRYYQARIRLLVLR